MFFYTQTYRNMTIRMIGSVVLLLAGLLVAGQGGAQEIRPLTLAEAVEEAVAGNRGLAAARARADAAEAAVKGSDSFMWPTLGVDAATIRTNDPVGVFGTKLRQGRFTEEDFAIDALNHPDAVTDWSAGVGARWAILDPSAWAERNASRYGVDAARWGVQRSREGTEFQTRVLYYAALRAQARLDAARAAEEAAAATLELFQRRAVEGVLTDADVLQVASELRGAEAARIHSEQMKDDALARIAVFLGWDAGVLPDPTDQLVAPDPAPAPQLGMAGEEMANRADILAMAAGTQVAREKAKQASRVRLPALEAFGRAAVHSAALDEFQNNWTVGLQLSWPVFTGFGASAGRDQALAQARAADYEREDALATARAEVDAAQRGVSSAAGRVEATSAAHHSAAEARRLVERRFQEGMATTVDLLQAEARLTDMRARAVDALADYHLAVARLQFVAATHTPDDNR